MPESWRNILERAAANLSIELEQNTAPAFRQQPARWSAARRPSQRPNSPVDSRNVLARELEAISRPKERRNSDRPRQRASGYPVAAHEAPIAPAVSQPTQPPRQREAKKSNPAHELAALSISVAIVVLAVYGFFFLLK